MSTRSSPFARSASVQEFSLRSLLVFWTATILLAVWTSTFAASPALAAPDRAARDVLASVRKATGGKRWSQVQRIQYEGQFAVGGLSGRFESVESLIDERRVTSFDLGVIAGSQGHDGTQPWSADAAGLVDIVEDQESLRRAATDGFLSRRAYLRDDAPIAEASVRTEIDANGARYKVVALTPVGGTPVELWVDRNNLIARIVRPDLAETTELSDYRNVDGLRLPHRLQVSDPSNNPQTYSIDSYRLNAGDESKLRRPRSLVRDVQMSAAAGSLPAYVQSGHVFIEAAIGDNEPALFVLDTGASINVLTPAAAKALNVQTQGSLKASGVGEEQPSVSLAKIPVLRVGPATLTDQNFAIVPLPSLTARVNGETREAIGLLGYDFFRRFLVTIDYHNERVAIEPLRECSTQSPYAVPLFLDSNRLPKLRAKLDGVEVLWTVDVGAATPLSIAPSVAQQLGLPESAGALYVRSGGVGGVSRERLLKFDVLEIGPHRIPEPLAGVSEQKAGAFAQPGFGGNLGYPTLRNFTPRFDYECRVVELTPSEVFGTPELADRAGITWKKQDDGTWRVLHVVPNAPAERAGLKPGDKLLALEGESLETLTRERFWELHARPAGSKLNLRVERDRQTIAVSVVLADFIPRAATYRATAERSPAAP